MFSSGAGSYEAARRVQENLTADDTHTLLFSDVSMEDPDNYRFLHEAATKIGSPLVVLKDGRDIWQVFKDRKFLGNSRLANCSQELKQKPAHQWLAEHCDPADTTIVIGIDFTEAHREPKISAAYDPYPVLMPLLAPPYRDKQQILTAMREDGLRPPRLYAFGFAHANCGGGCVRAGEGQFARLLTLMPTRFAQWEQGEQSVRDHLGKDVSILKSGTLAQFRERHATDPDQIDMFDIGGCGCFTE